MTQRVIILARRDTAKANPLTKPLFGSSKQPMRQVPLLPLSLALIIVAVLLGVIGTRAVELQILAEQTGVKSLLATLDSALGMRVAQYQARQDRRAIEALAGSNPMDNLAHRPENYRGVLADGTTVEPGNWYFNRRSQSLVYRVRNVERFRGGAKNPVRARFAIRLVFQDQNGNGVYDREIEQLEGVRLMPLEPYQWTN